MTLRLTDEGYRVALTRLLATLSGLVCFRSHAESPEGRKARPEGAVQWSLTPDPVPKEWSSRSAAQESIAFSTLLRSVPAPVRKK